jgi:hypothetical protein
VLTHLFADVSYLDSQFHCWCQDQSLR